MIQFADESKRQSSVMTGRSQ